jgi:hypothetical protein
MTEAFESGNRRAEVDGARVQFFRMTGNVRRSKVSVLINPDCGDVKRARRLAVRWTRKGKLGQAALV